MQTRRPPRRTTWNHWLRHCATAGTISMVCGGWTVLPHDVFAQSGFMRFRRTPQPETPAAAPAPAAPAPTGFALTVQRLMEQSRREAAAGEIDAAIKAAQRAKKIAEAASSSLGASPDCSPAAADQLYRELLALRPSTSPAPVSVATAPPIVTAPVQLKSAAIPQTTMPTSTRVVATEDVPAPHPSNRERWQPLQTVDAELPAPVVARVIAAPKPEPIPDEVYFPEEAPASIVLENEVGVTQAPVTLKRSYDSTAPIATELGLASSLDIVGGDRADSSSDQPRLSLPIEEPVVTADDTADPQWVQSEALVAAAVTTIPTMPVEASLSSGVPIHAVPQFVDMTALPSKPAWEAPAVESEAVEEPQAIVEIVTAPARVRVATDWTSSGAVVQKHRTNRNPTLLADGWQSTDTTTTQVTRAGGSVAGLNNAESTESVATTAFRSTDQTDMTTMLPIDDPTTVTIAPPPPEEFDNDEADLLSPSVWKRTGIATVPPVEPAAVATPHPQWQQFSAWAQRHGWTGTAALLGLCAAVLAVAAFVLALIPRERRSV